MSNFLKLGGKKMKVFAVSVYIDDRKVRKVRFLDKFSAKKWAKVAKKTLFECEISIKQQEISYTEWIYFKETQRIDLPKIV